MKDMRVVVTGGAGGIGLAIARALLEQGSVVMLVGRDRGSLASARHALAAFGDRVATQVCDVTQPGDRSALVVAATAWRGGANVLVNNAGVGGLALFGDLSSVDIERTLAVNLLGPIQLCHDFLPLLLEQPRARIVNIGSVFGSIGYPGQTVYSASKFGLRGFTESLRRELAGTSVGVHYLAPRATRTSLNEGASERLNAELGATTDDPSVVGRALVTMLSGNVPAAVVGWPEKFFARVNAVLPGVVDGALRKQLPTIRRHAKR
jgi:NAD(P)-dependent dehydrogenase (short-subunit alcohol dehydrogenase family)